VVTTDGYNMDLLGEFGAASMISKIASGRADVASAPDLIESVTATAAALIKRQNLGTSAPAQAPTSPSFDLTHRTGVIGVISPFDGAKCGHVLARFERHHCWARGRELAEVAPHRCPAK